MRYIIKRLLQSIIVLLLVSVIIFAAVRLAPGDPVLMKLGPYNEPTPEAVAQIEKELGLDKPVIVQYGLWLKGVLGGDLGVSMRNGVPVTQLIADKLPASLELIIVSILLSLLLAIPAGILAASKKNSIIDKAISTSSVAFLAIPSFWAGLLLLMIFAVGLKWLPASGYVSFVDDPAGNIRHLILPVISLSMFEIANFTRFVRSDMIEVLNSNYVRTAKAKGLSKVKVLFRHAFKNTQVTLITVVGIELGTLLGGTVICEQLFGWSGVGWLVFQAISNRDYAVVQGTVLIIAVVFVLINLIVDIVYTIVDPRISLE